MKKLFAIMMAIVMLLSMTAMAATITITPPELSEGDNQIGITYTAYKVFDAVVNGNNVAYSIDFSNPFYNTIKDSGYFTLTQLNGTTTYIVEANSTYTTDAAKTLAGQLNAVGGKTAAGNVTVAGENKGELTLDEGYYLITSTVGDALILDTTKNDTINTKNSYPTIGKTVAKADVQLGDKATFTITVTIPADASGEIVVHDTMTNLVFDAMTAPAAGVTAAAGTVADGVQKVDFTINADTVAAGGTVTITYTAVVTADTAKNEAYVQDHNFTSKPVEVEVKNYKFDVFKFEKVDGADSGLAGAGFVVMNNAGKYYKLDNNVVTWVDSIAAADEHFSAADGKVAAFTGLANGTYTLVEKTVPAGYNAAQNVTVTIDNADQTGTIKVENKTGTELPSTGGMGTTLFYTIGGLMMAFAVVVLVAKKKVAAK